MLPPSQQSKVGVVIWVKRNPLWRHRSTPELTHAAFAIGPAVSSTCPWLRVSTAVKSRCSSTTGTRWKFVPSSYNYSKAGQIMHVRVGGGSPVNHQPFSAHSAHLISWPDYLYNMHIILLPPPEGCLRGKSVLCPKSRFNALFPRALHGRIVRDRLEVNQLLRSARGILRKQQPSIWFGSFVLLSLPLRLQLHNGTSPSVFFCRVGENPRLSTRV